VVSDPRSLPEWWPGVERVEEATPEAWTKLLRSSKGKLLRADFTRTEFQPPRALAWRQELDESPFERFMSESTTRVSLDAPASGTTGVELRAVRRLRGLARLGWPLVRRATRRQLAQALSCLDETLSLRGRGER
jgi:Polyketide cyclase / dehydrase and lipid transport